MQNDQGQQYTFDNDGLAIYKQDTILLSKNRKENTNFFLQVNGVSFEVIISLEALHRLFPPNAVVVINPKADE